MLSFRRCKSGFRFNQIHSKRPNRWDGYAIIILADDSGEVTVVAWNEKALELEKNLRPNAIVQLGNAKVKESQNGGIEVHVDFTSFVNCQVAAKELLKIASLVENQSANVNCIVSAVFENKEVTTSKGEVIRLVVLELRDETGTIRV